MILYGSRARGDATASSDWDLKVIVSDDAADRTLSLIVGWKLQKGSGVPADVSRPPVGFRFRSECCQFG
ncbi:nucleotidyltransferase domain-containing protein [Rhizobium leguminosarum]|uniref:nucleotidyltransferase domain-containing protein n=1 Tax=Rhizobium leguminosarum TaxID=384 RepID=UPI00195449BA